MKMHQRGLAQARRWMDWVDKFTLLKGVTMGAGGITKILKLKEKKAIEHDDKRGQHVGTSCDEEAASKDHNLSEDEAGCKAA
jgi:hypothetical protein